MAHLTKAQQQHLQIIVDSLIRGNSLLQAADIAVCRVKAAATTTLDYKNAVDTHALSAINKEIGSDLTGIPDGIHQLLQFIANNTK